MSVLLMVSAGSFIASIAAKNAAEHFLSRVVPVIGSFVTLQYSTNAGVAFGMDLGRWQSLLVAIALIAVMFLAFRGAQTRLSQVSFGLIIGGAIANIVDRLGDGFVTDYVSVGSFPVFNLADSCITVGVVLLLMEMLWKGKR